MINAKQEFLTHVLSREILCVRINFLKNDNEVSLSTGWDKEEFDTFLNKIDINYYNGFGAQEVEGTIWYIDGTWSSREEYDGSEWWVYYFRPPVPKEMDRVDKVRDQKITNIVR